MPPLTVGYIDQMLNLSKNSIKLLRTHFVVGIEPVWILSSNLYTECETHQNPYMFDL